MDFRQLEIFAQVLETRSFSRAAQALGLSQPTASEHIKSLEDELGVKLFDRLGRCVEPTKAGLLLRPFALNILSAREEARSAIDEFMNVIRGHLALGASTIPAGYLLPRLLGRFKDLYPDTTISIVGLDSRQVVEGVADGEFEIGVTGARLVNDQLIYRLFATDDLVLAVHPENELAGRKKIKTDDLMGVKMILREEGSGTRSEAESRLRELGFEISPEQIVAVMGGAEAVRTALRENVGAAIVSRLAVEGDISQGLLKVVGIEGFDCTREFHSVVHKARSLTPLAKRFLAFLHDEGDG